MGILRPPKAVLSATAATEMEMILKKDPRG